MSEYKVDMQLAKRKLKKNEVNFSRPIYCYTKACPNKDFRPKTTEKLEAKLSTKAQGEK